MTLSLFHVQYLQVFRRKYPSLRWWNFYGTLVLLTSRTCGSTSLTFHNLMLILERCEWDPSNVVPRWFSAAKRRTLHIFPKSWCNSACSLVIHRIDEGFRIYRCHWILETPANYISFENRAKSVFINIKNSFLRKTNAIFLAPLSHFLFVNLKKMQFWLCSFLFPKTGIYLLVRLNTSFYFSSLNFSQ